ncbi:HEAT repeat domain-containing protein [bacterium]|nr:HEAT repeat domain-containing protein [bacterium]
MSLWLKRTRFWGPRAMYKVVFIALVLAARIASAAPAEHVEDFEDLAKVALPHGIVELPARGSARARRAGGYILRFRDGSLHVSPLDGQHTGSPDLAAVRNAILKERTGDLYCSGAPTVSLLAWSGRIAALGPGFLFELSGKELPRPPAASGEQRRDGQTGKGYPGRVDAVRTDGRYLVETVDGRYALIRVLEKASSFAVAQWVYQPSGARVFKTPKLRLLTYKPRATPAERLGYVPRKGKRPGPSAGVPGEEQDAAARVKPFPEGTVNHLKAREALVKQLMQVVENREGSASSRARGFAAEALGRIRAPEAASLLASLVDVPLPHSAAKPDPVRPAMGVVMYGAVPALVRIGKPGARACVQALCKLDSDERRKTSKPQFLCRVLVQVEGKTVALMLIRKMLAEGEDEQVRKNLELALKLVMAGGVQPVQSPGYRLHLRQATVRDKDTGRARK